ncbi:MAG: pantetheine-phosphate adenylyltransferase [Deltaproteobacteria bacterium]|nr:pantetheine-phosphate adenylyltransferase [Deltaproteobacteria bacterium]
MTVRRALYPGSFDPLTNGHLDMIRRVSPLFDELVLGIGVNHSKESCFSLEDRLDMLRQECLSYGNIVVLSFHGLAVDCARECGAGVIVRGLRNGADYISESQMMMANFVLDPGIETILIPAKAQFAHISSSLVKEVAARGGRVSAMVPEAVRKLLSLRYSGDL